MESTGQAQQANGYQRSRVNYFGRRAPASHRAPTRAVASPRPTDSLVGKPYFPNNGHGRHLNFLGRTSTERTDRLLVNRR